MENKCPKCGMDIPENMQECPNCEKSNENNNNDESITNTLKAKAIANPLMTMYIIQIVMLFLKGYYLKDNFLKSSSGRMLLIQSFESFGNIEKLGIISIIFRVFIVFSPIILLMISILHLQGKKIDLAKKILPILGLIGSILFIHYVHKGNNLLQKLEELNIDDSAIKNGLSIWITCILFIVQIIHSFINKESSNTSDEIQKSEDDKG